MPSPGQRFGPYEIIASIGAGGMGEVFRARDTKLGRDVAIKFVPDAVANDPVRLARFEREAQTLAALNHPNIAQVYGFESGALVMELLDGEALSARIASGPLTIRKATEYGAQIARGLAAAHERGVVHRDLKPDNVFVLRDGHLKIIDFGLAKETARAVSGVTQTMTAATPATDAGTVMGTVGYMAPEQVRGEPLDARADLFALGTVLYEMLSGRRAFKGDSAADTMSAILRDDPPDLLSLRPDVNAGLDRIVRHCLEKNPVERFQTARDVAFALDALSHSGSGSTTAAALDTRPRSPQRERAAWIAVAAILAALAAWLGVRPAPSGPPAPAAPAYRATLLLPEDVSLSGTVAPMIVLNISRDGRQIAFVGSKKGANERTIWVMSTDQGEARELRGTEGAAGPTFSPDGRSLAFSNDRTLKRMDLDSGATLPLGSAGYGVWGTNDELLLTAGPPSWVLRRGPARGGSAVDLLTPNRGERLESPIFLPDGQRFIFGRARTGASSVEVGNINSPSTTKILDNPGIAGPHYANGAIVYAMADRLFAVRFDPETLQVSGDPVSIADHVDYTTNQGASFALSDNGVIVYAPLAGGGKSALTWFDRSGKMLSQLGDSADYSNIELSPDGTRLATSVTDLTANTRDIYVLDVRRGVRQRLTFDASDERSAIWSHDGKQIIYNSKGLDLFRRAADFSGVEEALPALPGSKDPRDVTADGRLLYRQSGMGTGNDLWLLPLAGDRTPKPIFNSPFDENYGAFSPDGRSVVFMSNESGDPEIYVSSLDGGGAKVQVSPAGGSFPRWRSPNEIVYLGRDLRLMSVAVTGSGASFSAGAVTPLFFIDAQPGPGSPFDVTSDGQRFIVNAKLPSRIPPSLNLIINWPSLLTTRRDRS